MNNINNDNTKVPEGWKVELLDKICKLSYGKNLPTEKFIDDGKYPVYGANGLIGFYVDYTHKDEVILVSCRGEYSGVINLSQPFSFITNNSIPLEIKNNDEIFTRFLFYRIKIIPKQTFVSGSAQPQVVINDLKRLIITIPISFVEQQKIAEILETVDRAIEKTDKIIEKYKLIKQGLMQDLLTKGIDENGKIRSEKTHKFKNSPLGRIPEEWEVVEFGDFIEIVHGYQFREYDFKDEGIKVIKITQINDKGLDINNCSYVNKNLLEILKKKIIKQGDVLMALTGATLGKTCFVKDLNEPVLQNYRVGRFEIKNNEFNKMFIYFLLNTKKITSQIFNNVNSGAQGNIGKSDFIKVKIIKPLLPEQQRIAEILSQIDNTIEKEEAYKQKLERIKKGLMEDLLTGRVRVNKLIKEVKNEK